MAQGRTGTGMAAKAAAPNGAVQRRFDSFLATARPVTPEDAPLLHELAVGVLWPHRERDMDMLLRVGQGYISVDEIGRAMGSTMYFRTDGDLTFLGMMTVMPRLQARGTGRWLLRMALEDVAGCDLRLTATRQAYILYESHGFVPCGRIAQHQGIAQPVALPDAAPGVTLRPIEAGDFDAILALDAHAYGARRSRILTAVHERSGGVVATRGGQIRGFAMIRNFGRGRVIGPVVAETQEAAIAMVAPLVRAHEGQFLRLDTPAENEVLRTFITAAGLGLHDNTVTEMVRGTNRRARSGPVMLAMASHSLG